MRETVVKVNDKGILLVVLSILLLAFALGLAVGKYEKKEGMEFTRKEIETIQNAMDTYGKDVTVKREKDGSLTISATFGDTDVRMVKK